MIYINVMFKERETKYARAVMAYMQTVGHAVNAEVIGHLRLEYPELSATTVHRLTARMVQRGQLAQAPPSRGNAARLDANLTPHDHFECLNCGCLRDVILPQELFDSLQTMLQGCRFEGRLTIQGTCTKCLVKEEG
jgi:Fe2+ or Zn2+ uptake regulation protein